MYNTKSLLSKLVTASFVAKLAFLFLVSMQSISIAHDLFHHEHVESEICEVLNAFGANKIIIPTDVINLNSFHNNSQGNVDYSSFFGQSYIVIRRSRSPPLPSLS